MRLSKGPGWMTSSSQNPSAISFVPWRQIRCGDQPFVSPVSAESMTMRGRCRAPRSNRGLARPTTCLIGNEQMGWRRRSCFRNPADRRPPVGWGEARRHNDPRLRWRRKAVSNSAATATRRQVRRGWAPSAIADCPSMRAWMTPQLQIVAPRCAAGDDGPGRISGEALGRGWLQEMFSSFGAAEGSRLWFRPVRQLVDRRPLAGDDLACGQRGGVGANPPALPARRADRRTRSRRRPIDGS